MSMIVRAAGVGDLEGSHLGVRPPVTCPKGLVFGLSNLQPVVGRKSSGQVKFVIVFGRLLPILRSKGISEQGLKKAWRAGKVARTAYEGQAMRKVGSWNRRRNTEIKLLSTSQFD